MVSFRTFVLLNSNKISKLVNLYILMDEAGAAGRSFWSNEIYLSNSIGDLIILGGNILLNFDKEAKGTCCGSNFLLESDSFSFHF